MDRAGRTLISRLTMPLVLLVGHVSAALFLANLAMAPSQVTTPWLRGLLKAYFHLYQDGLQNQPLLRLILASLAGLVLLRAARGLPVQLPLELLGWLLCIRCLVQFVFLNLLLLAPLKAGGLLLLQLVAFLPVITVAFGWLYWRLDSGARREGRRHLRFVDPDDDAEPRSFEYFHASALTLLQFDPTVATAVSRLMKALFVLHGVMMMDLVALTLSRAIGLASSGS
jgi:hypothetical protein